MATPRMRAIRVHDRVWDRAREQAAADGRTLADVINECLERYGDTPSERRARRAPHAS